jgi:S1-C subfamily serine protease
VTRAGVALTFAAGLLAATPVAALTQAAPPPPLGIVAVEAGGGRVPEVATGFTAGAHVVTVAHVLAHLRTVTLRGAGGRARTATVERIDASADLAVLTSAGIAAAPAPPVAGVRAIVRRDGRAVALPVRVRRRITATVRDATTGRTDTREALELDADIRAGDSGAPVVAPGRVLGVIFARSAERPAAAYAVASPTGGFSGSS